MISANLPDGSVLKFPDGTDDAVIDKTVADHVATTKTQADAQAANSGVGGFVDSLGRSIASGVTFNLADEIAAGGDALLGHFVGRGSQADTIGERYDANLTAERARDKAFQSDHPIIDAAGNIAGGVGGAIVAAPAAAAGPVVSAGRAAANYIGTGAIYGGLAGFGEGEGGLQNRLITGAMGAGAGGVAGGVLGGLASAASGVGGRIATLFGKGDSEAAAERLINRNLSRDKVTPEQVQDRFTAAGDQPVALVDVGGRNTVNLGATAANTPSEAMEVADKFVEGRRLGRPDRLTATGDEVFGGGSGTDLPEIRAALREKRSAAGELYDRAFKIEPNIDEYARLAPWVNDRIGQDAMQRGLRVAELEHLAEGTPFKPADFGVTRGEGGKFVPVEGQTPNMRLLDAVKRGYDEIVEGFRDPTSGRLNLDQYGRAVDANRRAYRDSLAEMYPSYGRALQAWAGPSAQLDALKAGESALNVNRDVVADRMTRPPDEQAAYRTGAGRAFSDKVSDPASASGQARRLLEDGQMQARLASLLGPEDLATLNDTLRREVQMTAVERAVGPRSGSQTGRLAAGGADMAGGVPGPIMTAISQVLGGHPVQGAMTAGKDIVVRRLGQGINPATSDALANKLFRTEPAERAAIYASLQNRMLTDQALAARARGYIRPVARGIAEYSGGDLLR